MNITIKINTDNAAFQDNPCEVERIMKKLTRNIEQGYIQTTEEGEYFLTDINGNKVGTVTIAES
jgi:hypothetical protein